LKRKYIIYADNSNDLFVNQKIIDLKFQKFCYLGAHIGEYHYFIDGKCVKCGEVYANILAKKYTLNDYFSLLQIVENKSKILLDNGADGNGGDVRKIKKEKISELKQLLNTFKIKLFKILGRSGDKIFVEKYEKFIDGIGNYSNLYATEKIKDVRKFIQATNNRDETRIDMIKTYINQYFRKYISIIANGYYLKDRIKKIPYVDLDVSNELQKFIYDETEYFREFYTEDNMEIFGKLKFEYSIKDINSINGLADRYNCTAEKIIKKSNFSLKNAFDILIYILFGELDKFLDIGNGEKTIAMFIVKMFDLIIKTDNITNVSEEDTLKYKNILYYNDYCAKDKKITIRLTSAEKDYIQSQLDEVAIEQGIGVDVVGIDGAEVDLDPETLMEKDADELIEEEMGQMEDTAIEELAREKLGKDATDNEIELYKEKYYKELRDNDELMREFDMNDNLEEEGEILEVGDDYGEMDQGGRDDD